MYALSGRATVEPLARCAVLGDAGVYADGLTNSRPLGRKDCLAIGVLQVWIETSLSLASDG
jgi:hypothetical protein